MLLLWCTKHAETVFGKVQVRNKGVVDTGLEYVIRALGMRKEILTKLYRVVKTWENGSIGRAGGQEEWG
ncbi:hypothetical protein Spica_1071 [Gracilinema caldarium DSM 7334]|uniref:Uncharacterized protein n=1 Tax=Gracilinema caldarium (strain ATCC 51460 / DSM 7334 / H1) TaxID=744872 RepID=F8EYY8_GRAC1|nr:hypothetical protein Spica_1071 [Gracilinema caldarium DSM 7334]